MLSVDTDFPGGNAIVDSIDGDTISLHQDVRDTEGDWFWFNFRVRGASGRTLTVRLTKSAILGVRGPAVSVDGAQTWSWLGAEHCRDNREFRVCVPAGCDDLRCAFGIPYTSVDWQKFLAGKSSPHLQRGELCKTPAGRTIETLRVGKLSGASAKVLLTCRHHCCESVPNFSLEGLIDFIHGVSEAGRYLRENVECLIVPFMDVDGVEAGDQGKNRKPYDHNRDYAGESIYASVRALKNFAPDWSAGKVKVFLDLHCPWIRGPHNECIYLVGSPSEANWARVGEFSRVLEASTRGPLPYRVSDNLPFGQGWNDYPGPRMTSGRWAETLPGLAFSSTMEIPYANVGGVEVNPGTARAFGADLARAIATYLKQIEPATL
jgi:hypothetical protein